MLKFEFSLQTKNGQHIDNIVIAGQTQADAERKLYQMYHHCTILSCASRVVPERLAVGSVHSSVEEIVDLIARQ